MRGFLYLLACIVAFFVGYFAMDFIAHAIW